MSDKKQPNIVVITDDDIGMWNIGAYHRGLMASKTPNIDKLVAEGANITNCYRSPLGEGLAISGCSIV